MLDPKRDIHKIAQVLTLDSTRDSFRQAGTIIGTSRANLFSEKNIAKDIPQIAIKNLKILKLDCLCAIGGDDTLGAAYKLSQLYEFPILGAPKTMDNDLFGTDKTFGFDSAYCEAERLISQLHATARSHRRVFVVEVMGRHSGWVALFAGIAAGAGAIEIPECNAHLHTLAQRAKKMMSVWGYGIIVISEGARIFSQIYPERVNASNRKILDRVIKNPTYALVKARLEKPEKVDAFGHPVLSGVGEIITAALESLTPGIEYRYQNCGHLIRSRAYPSDTLLGLRFGNALFDYIKEGKFQVFPAVEGERIVPKPLSEAKGGRLVYGGNYQDLLKMKDLIDFY